MEETRFARIWANWENALASVHNDGPLAEGPAEYARAFSRLENHYFRNAAFWTMTDGSWPTATALRISRPMWCRDAMT
jgi:proline iminopeptidase